MKRQLFIILFLISFSVSAAPSWLQKIGAPEVECLKKGQIKITYMGRTLTEEKAYCFSKTRSHLLSSNCKSGACAILKSPVCEAAKRKNLYNEVGSPGFRLCNAVGGHAELLEFYDGKKWWTMDRCRHTKDGSFVDTGILLSLLEKCKG